MTIEDLEADLKQSKLNGIYLLYGTETYLLESMLKKIKKEFGELIPGINYISINESNIDKLISNIETPSFGYEKKLIIVKNAGLFKERKNIRSRRPANDRKLK